MSSNSGSGRNNNNSSGGRNKKGVDPTPTVLRNRAEQARRQRLVQRQSSATQQQPSQQRQRQPTDHDDKDDNAALLIGRSMEAGEEVASLLASIQQQSQKQKQKSTKPKSTTSTTIVSSSSSRQQPRVTAAVQPRGGDNAATTTTTTTTGSSSNTTTDYRSNTNRDAVREYSTNYTASSASSKSNTTTTTQKATTGVGATAIRGAEHQQRGVATTATATATASAAAASKTPTAAAAASSNGIVADHRKKKKKPLLQSSYDDQAATDVRNNSNNRRTTTTQQQQQSQKPPPPPPPAAASMTTTTQHHRQQQAAGGGRRKTHDLNNMSSSGDAAAAAGIRSSHYPNNNNNDKKKRDDDLNNLIDAACVLAVSSSSDNDGSSTNIMLQSQAYLATNTLAAAAAASDTSNCLRGGLDVRFGKFLGQSHETFQLRQVYNNTAQQQQPPLSCLCFGDRITLQYTPIVDNDNINRRKDDDPSSLLLFLGVQTTNDENYRTSSSDRTDYDHNQNKSYTVRFLPATPTSNNRALQWIVFSGSEPHVQVGTAALEQDAIQRVRRGGGAAGQTTTTAAGAASKENRSSSRNNNSSQRRHGPVRFGDTILLRNYQTGGILSCRHGQFQVLTDAYGQPTVAPPLDEEEDELEEGGGSSNVEGERPTLLTRLQRCHTLVPTEYEGWVLRPASSPKLPLWMQDKFFLNHSHLSHPHRHHDEDMMAAAAKSNNSDDPVATTCRTEIAPLPVSETIRKEAQRQLATPAGQERMLLDEWIGCCLGLEGSQFIVCSQTDNKNDTDGSSFEFRLQPEIQQKQHKVDVLLSTLMDSSNMLKLPNCLARVRRFVAQHQPGYEYGNVMQAFCECLDKMLQEQTVNVLKWQRQMNSLSLRRLELEMKSTLRVLSILDQACTCVQQYKGGALLNALRQLRLQQYKGDDEADCILQELLASAARPYLRRLVEWLDDGKLPDDPVQEFMIGALTDGPSNDGSWDGQYLLRTDNILQGYFSTQRTLDQVLATGRYWNALRTADSKHKFAEPVAPVGLSYASDSATVSAYVQSRYQASSKALVRLLREEYNLIDALRLMKRFFLLEYGDFFVDFLDKAEEELLKDIRHLSRNRVQHWIVSSLELLGERGGSSENENNWASCGGRIVTPAGLRCRFSTEGLSDRLDKLHAPSGGIDTHEPWTPARHTYGGALASSRGELTGLDTFFLDFAAMPFPTSLVISSKAMECYQLLFRHIFLAKYVERRLVAIWSDHQAMKELQALRAAMGPTFLLRQRMLHFVHNLIYYMMFEVIEPNWHIMETAIETPRSGKEQTVDDIVQVHGQFLQRTLEACLLTNRDLVRALTRLMKTCLLFSEQMKRFMRATKIDEERRTVALEMQNAVQHNLNARGGERSSKQSAKYIKEILRQGQVERQQRIQRHTARVEHEVSGESYQRMVTRFEEVFSKNLKDFMAQLTNSDDLYYTHKVNLCIRLDYNGFVTKSLGLT